jgi:hypothetical protein
MAEMETYKDVIPEFVFKLHHILEVHIFHKLEKLVQGLHHMG